MAGTSVDVALFPLDTVKTRLQSAEGFWKSGGFRGVYRGLSVAAAGSAPGGVHIPVMFCLVELVNVLSLVRCMCLHLASRAVLQHI